MPVLSLCFRPESLCLLDLHSIAIFPMVEEVPGLITRESQCNPSLSPGCAVSAHWLLEACPKVSEQHSHKTCYKPQEPYVPTG